MPGPQLVQVLCADEMDTVPGAQALHFCVGEEEYVPAKHMLQAILEFVPSYPTLQWVQAEVPMDGATYPREQLVHPQVVTPEPRAYVPAEQFRHVDADALEKALPGLQ